MAAAVTADVQAILDGLAAKAQPDAARSPSRRAKCWPSIPMLQFRSPSSCLLSVHDLLSLWASGVTYAHAHGRGSPPDEEQPSANGHAHAAAGRPAERLRISGENFCMVRCP